MPFRFRRRSLAAFLLALSGLAGSALPGADGPFRGFLEGEPSPMIFLPAGKEMTLAYDERGGSLFLAWKGTADPLPGPGNRFRPSGAVRHRRSASSPWSVRGPKGIIPVTVTFKSLRTRGPLTTLEWTLGLPGGRAVSVAETPAFDDHYGDAGLFREFAVAGLPEGATLRLDLTGTGLPESWGGGGDGALAEEEGRRLLVQSRDGMTPVKVTWSERPSPGDPAHGGGWK